MKILILGDIYGQSGLFAVRQYLPLMKAHYQPDIVIVNAENTSEGGKSLDKKDYDVLMSAGVDYITMGNHTFRREDIKSYIDEVDNIVRPGNSFQGMPGRSSLIIPYKNKKILLFNMLGQSLMPRVNATSPFEFADKLLKNNDYDLAICDFHAESTAEKIIVGNYLKDRVGIFYGTHTHVQTADERIINDEQAFITDLGMCGVLNSAIGADFETITQFLINKNAFTSPFKLREASGDVRINGVIVTLYDNTLRPSSIERVQENIYYSK